VSTRPRSSFKPPRLAIEAVVIFGLIALAAFLVYHFVVVTIRNPRPLGGANVDVSHAQATQSDASFAIDPIRPRILFGASNDSGGGRVRVYDSSDGGATWRRSAGPAAPGGSCARGEPRVAIDRDGRQYLAFTSGAFCGDALTPYLVFTSRASAHGRWAPLVRIAPKAWRYGFDDAPDLALDERSGRLYLAWTRSLSVNAATVVVSRSRDGGRTWSEPLAVAAARDHPHLASIAVAPGGDVYVAGIDTAHGIWIARSSDGGRTFGAPRAAGRLLANPAAECSLAALSPLPREEQTCAGPNPTVVTRGNRVFVVYDDVGANQTQDVFVAAFDSSLRRLFRTRVNPPDRGAAQQFFPAATVDATTGALWACWYDTTFDPNAHRTWFTCSASHDGRTWTAPERAAAVPTLPVDLYSAVAAGGLRPALAARGGVAHAFWADGRIVNLEQEVFTAALRQRAAFGG
jgi:hypothetical protein